MKAAATTVAMNLKLRQLCHIMKHHCKPMTLCKISSKFLGGLEEAAVSKRSNLEYESDGYI